MQNIKWSPSRLKAAEHCLAWYFYRYHDEDKSKIPTRPPLVFGNLFHSMMERFYNENGTPFYKSTESFTNAAIGQWLHAFTKDDVDNRGKEIIWEYNGQKFVMIRDIEQIAPIIYRKYADPKTPRPIFQELGIKVNLEGVLLNGKIDAILPHTRENGLLIVDYKTDRFPPGRDRISYDPQFSAYALLVGIKLSQDPEFRRKTNFPEEEAEKLSIENLFLHEEIKTQYDHLRTGESVVVERRIEDVERYLVSIKDREEQIHTNNFIRSPGKHCVRCDRREKCDDDTKNEVKLELPENNQIELFPQTTRIKKSRKRPQKSFRFPKDNG